jgi:GMP synthase (glutamine-hydrolysing)
MRDHESAEVATALSQAGFDNLHVINAQQQFLNAVAGLTDPEAKRKAIGKAFLDVQAQAMKDLKLNSDEWILGQGTIYPDTIETGGTKTSDKIKTHHNRVDEIMELIKEGRVIEPLAELYKDEVRELGKNLGLPDTIVGRWPFPGPGLAIRLLCSDGETVDVAEATQQQVDTIAQTAGSYRAFVLPVRSVGVQGDQRSYQHPALVYAVDPNEKINWSTIGQLSVRITNDVIGVNRVVYELWNRDYCGGGRAPEEWPELFQATATLDRADKLREAEKIVTEIIARHGIQEDIWQFPIVLLPLRCGTENRETVVLRPIQSQEAMTVNFYAMPDEALTEIVTALSQLDWLDAIFYDVTNKPPSTIEWE